MAPHVRVLVNFAASIDGKIHPAPGLRHGAFAMSRGKEDWKRMRLLRRRADAIVIGATNLRVDDPGLSLESDERERRRVAGEPLPLRIVVTRNGEGIRADAKMFAPDLGGDSYVVHAASMPTATRDTLSKVAHLVELGSKAVSIERMLAWLRDDLRAPTVLCEGGGNLVAQLFAARAVDELYLTLVPRILGGSNAPTLADGPGFDPDEIPDAKLASVEHLGDELYLRYDFRWT